MKKELLTVFTLALLSPVVNAECFAKAGMDPLPTDTVCINTDTSAFGCFLTQKQADLLEERSFHFPEGAKVTVLSIDGTTGNFYLKVSLDKWVKFYEYNHEKGYL
jgi:hypothetical protein